MIKVTANSEAMKRMLSSAARAAATDVTVLVRGESGTGKGQVARWLHEQSPRRDAAFVVLDLSTVTSTLIESQLFGHARGAFTGATSGEAGRIERAERGTLFLDEVGELPLHLQPKLLRLVQDREYERVGESATRKADVRIVAATNRDLRRMVAAGSFREDLYYRL
jgi:transcriptional regulator with GAF, ATPase, and Fis domain